MKVAVNIKLDDQIKIKLQEIANEEHRTLSNLISKILIDYLKDKEKPQK